MSIVDLHSTIRCILPENREENRPKNVDNICRKTPLITKVLRIT